jgi:cell division protein ZapA
MNATTAKPTAPSAPKQVEVSILGQSYVLSCKPEEEAALHAAVAHVDHEMSAIRDLGKIKARERIAVLAALNIAYSLLNKADDAADKLAHAVDANGAPPAADWRVNNLVSRIDKALATDNQLL